MRDVVPGAIASAVIWQLLQSFGVIYVRHVIKHASATNAVFALVLGLLAFLYVTAVAALLCMEINVVRVHRLHPRSLLTPFTDNVALTAGDRRAYSRQAKAQREREARPRVLALQPVQMPRDRHVDHLTARRPTTRTVGVNRAVGVYPRRCPAGGQ